MEVEADTKNVDMVMDVKVQMTVQLGTCELPMREIIELSPGAVLQLRQQASDPVSLLANGKLIAYGEVVIVEDHFGVKITELVNNKES